MSSARHFLIAALLLWGAAVAQGRLAHAVSVGGAQPDFPLIVLSCGALLVGRAGGAWLGFWAGLLAAVSFPSAYGSLFVSRIAAGAFAGGVGRSLIRSHFLVPSLLTLAGTLLAELLTTFMSPGYAIHHPRHWAMQTGGELLYNSLLAFPIALLLRGLRVGQEPEDPRFSGRVS